MIVPTPYLEWRTRVPISGSFDPRPLGVAGQVIPFGPLLEALVSAPGAPVDPAVLRDLSHSPDQRFWLLREMQEALERAALRAPVLISLDDVQWADPATLAALGSLIYAEVAVRYPRSGGNYVFLREAYGPLAGFLYGWVEFWIIRSASIAALGIVLVESLADILRSPLLHISSIEPRARLLHRLYQTLR